MVRALLMVMVFVLLGLPAALVGIPYSALVGNTRVMYAWAMAIIRLGLKVAGVRVRVEGRGNIPAGVPCIFLSNHVSNLDPPVLLPVIPPMTSILLKKELMRIPLLGTAMRQGKFVPVARSRSREDARRSTEAAAEAIRSGRHITIFPEGTRSPDGQLLPFKKGAFYLAAETGVPLVPVIVRGTARMMPKGTNRLLPGEAVVEFLPAIFPGEFASREELMAAVRGAMERALQRP